MDEMIKGGLLPNVHRAVLDEDGFHSVRAKCAEHHGEEAHESGDAGEEELRHLNYFTVCESEFVFIFDAVNKLVAGDVIAGWLVVCCPEP